MATIGYLTPRGSRGSGTRPNAVSNDSRSPSVTSSGATSTAPGRGKRSSKTGAVRHDGMAGTVLHADLDAWHTHDQRGWAVPAPSPRSACRTSNPTPPHPLTDNAMALPHQPRALAPRHHVTSYLDTTLAASDLAAFARLDELGLVVVGKRVESGRAVLASRVAQPHAHTHKG